jgi:hypothetical protein
MIFGLFKKKPSAAKQEKVEGEVAGKVTHYFPHVKACVIKLEAPLKAGDQVRIKGHTTDFKEKVTSMQIMGKPVESAQKGEEIGLEVKKRVRAHDTVYRI